MISHPVTDALVRGVAELERTDRGSRPHRLPAWVRRQFPDSQLLLMEQQPSGAKIAVRTSARELELITHPHRLAYRGAQRPRGSVDLVVDGQLWASDELTGGDLIELDLRTGESRRETGPAHVSRFGGLPAGEKLIEVWLPHNEALELIALRAEQAIAPSPPPTRVWLHHGSSISHGSNATSPTRIWPAVAARLAGVELHNLGLGGSALVDPFLARVIRDAPADVISLKLGINVVNLDSMRRRAFVPALHGFLDTIRDGHPRTPLLLVSPIFCGIHEDTPGPGAVDPSTLGTDRVRFVATGTRGDTALGRLTLEVVREAIREVVAARADDPFLHHLEGTELYGEADSATHPLPDALHPDTRTHLLMGERFAARVFGADGAFGAVSG